MNGSRVRGAVLLLAGAAWGCAGDGSALDQGMLAGDEPTLANIQAKVFGVICVNCHVPGGPGDFMTLDSAENSYAHLVGQPSLEIPRLLRVARGDPDASYIVWKIEGQGPRGEEIAGERMPPPSAGEPALPAETIALIRQWIADGANP